MLLAASVRNVSQSFLTFLAPSPKEGRCKRTRPTLEAYFKNKKVIFVFVFKRS